MYYPYLRARQFELISVRELAIENMLQGRIMPVLEPVKESLSNLTLAHKVLCEKGQTVFLIVNPLIGELPGDNDNFLNYISNIDNCQYKVAFHYKNSSDGENNSEFITNSVGTFNLNNCLLICHSNFNDDANLRELCSKDFISHIMVFEPHKYRSLDRYIKTLGKNYIRLDDVFEKQTKNADFLDITAHKFSEEHLYYEEDGYQGFSDFTVLPSEYIDGGSTPRAVVIHLTYLNQEEENQIWIRHFTSESNDSIANVQGKFAEAAEKAISFCNVNGLNNSAIQELRDYFDEQRYPGLGTVKKISIKNHLLVVSDFLT